MKQKSGMSNNALVSLQGIGNFKEIGPKPGKKYTNSSRKHPYLREGFVFPCCDKGGDHEHE